MIGLEIFHYTETSVMIDRQELLLDAKFFRERVLQNRIFVHSQNTILQVIRGKIM